MANSNELDAAHRLATLQESFKQHLPERTAEIDQLWTAARDGRNLPVLTKLLDKIHSLAGSSGSFGYPGISEACHMLQNQLVSLVDDRRAFTETRVRIIDVLVKMLVRTVAATANRPSPLAAPAATKADGPPPLVYLLDDDPAMCEYVALHLMQSGYRVEAFQTVQQLKDALSNAQPAALLMDMMLPEGKLAGAKALIAIRAAHPLPLPVIFLSARDDMAARVAAIRAGADAYLTKPLDMGHLSELLGRLAGSTVQSPRVLIVDDDAFQGEWTSTVLESAGMQPYWLSEPGRILQVLDKFKPDLVLMDLYMPSIDGAELAAMIRQHLEWADLPLLFMSGETDPVRQASAIRRGGDDFLVKPVAPDTLIEAISLRLRRSQIRRSSSVLPDQLTPNGHALLMQHLDDCQQEPACALLFLSLDNGEALQNALGLLGMDELIIALEQRLKKQLSEHQHFNRFAAGAFAVTLPNASPDGARRTAERLCHAVAVTPLEVAGSERYVTCSAGIAISEPGLSGNDMVVRADVAARAARQQGANQVHVHDSQADQAATAAELQRQTSLIAQALKEDRLRLAFQPIVALRENPPTYYEALLRLRDGNNQEISPGVFMPIAEQAGLTGHIDQWVVQRAMKVAQAEESMGGAECYFIKLSKHALQDPAFPPWLEKTLIKSGQLGSSFTLEFSEEDLNHLDDTLRDSFAKFRKPGFNLLIDHFKGGERSVQLLHLVRPDFVRLSRQNITALATLPEHHEPLKEAIRVAHDLGAEVIGGYVENTETLGSLWQVDVDYMQGFFAQPPSELMGYDFREVVV